jgi:uncharacterized membrane protein
VTWHRDLRATLIATVVLTALALAVPVGWISLLLLVPVAFFLTGYAIMLAAFVGGPQPWPRAFWISLGLSLATLALLPLPLNYLGGLTAVSWAIALALVVLVACAVAALRRPSDRSDASPAPRVPRPSPLTALLGVGSLALVAAAIVLSQTTFANGKAEGFTELWMKAVPAAGASPAMVRIGVGNQEQHYTTYEVRARFAGGGEVERTLSLYPGSDETFELEADPQPTAAEPTFVSVTLKRRPEETDVPYRRVYGWIPAGAEE